MNGEARSAPRLGRVAAAGGEGELPPGREGDSSCAGAGCWAQPAAPAAFPRLAPWGAAGTSPIVLKNARAFLGLVKVPEC